MEAIPPLRRIDREDHDLGSLEPMPNSAFRPLDPRARYLWMIGRAIFWMIVLAGLLIIFLIKSLLNSAGLSYILGGLGLLFLLVMTHLFWPLLSYRCWGFAVRETDVLVRWGVIWKRTIVVPFARIQHVDSDSGPIDRMFGLGNLVIHTAGSEIGNVTIPCLPSEEAEDLRDFLSKMGHIHANL